MAPLPKLAPVRKSRWLLVVGPAFGTVANAISAYDKEVSDDLYGSGSPYVSRQRLDAMLDRECTLRRRSITLDLALEGH